MSVGVGGGDGRNRKRRKSSQDDTGLEKRKGYDGPGAMLNRLSVGVSEN